MVVTGRPRTSVGQRVGWLCPPWGLGAAERQCGKSKGGGTDGSAWSEPCHIWGACVPKDAGQRPRALPVWGRGLPQGRTRDAA